MGEHSKPHHREKDEKKKSKKRHHHRHDEDESDRKRHSKRNKKEILDNDEDMWVEKNIDMDGERVLATDIPSAQSLKLTSNAMEVSTVQLPPKSQSTLQRDDWMLEPSSSGSGPSLSTIPVNNSMEDSSFTEGFGEDPSNQRTLSGGIDFFSNLGTEHRKKNLPLKDNLNAEPVVSSKELNPDMRTSAPEISNTSSSSTVASPSKPTPGGPGSSWRMMRLRKVYDTAEEDNLPIEEVAIDRFGTLEAFEDAKEERRILDERGGGGDTKSSRGRGRAGQSSSGVGSGGEKGFMFNDVSGSGGSVSRASSFRRPGGSGGVNSASRPSTPSAASASAANKRLDSLRLPSQVNSPLARNPTHIPSVMTPPIHAAGSGSSKQQRAMSPSSLNRLQAKVLRAKLMGLPGAVELEKEYEREERKANGYVASSASLDRHEGVSDDDEDEGAPRDRNRKGGKEVRTKVELIPTLDGQGRLYDVGLGRDDMDRDEYDKKKRKKAEKNFETRDSNTGDLVRYSKDDDDMTLGEMLRQEKMKGGMSDQKNMDAEYAKAISTDVKYKNDLDYIDDNAEKLGRKKMRSDAMKRQFAIQDYKRTQQALATCPFCFAEDDSPPKAPMVSMGTRVYLSCTLTEELVEGHCLIVPVQHHLCLLEGDDDVWDEVQNFMKCLMRMYAEQDKGVVFYETVISHKLQKHSYIECVPMSWEAFETMPGYFKESILSSESEWSQHKKLIEFTKKPFRRAMVPNLPYFMVQFDYKGEKGYGHVIEGSTKADEAEEEWGLGEMGNGGKGEFPRWFAGEIIGNVLGMEEARLWRNPKKISFAGNNERVRQFRAGYSKFDWTGLIG